MKVSIIIPCYNVAEHLPNCLNSALDSSYQDIEVICIDDGSIDDTSKVIEDFVRRFPGKIRSEKGTNIGASAARNKGMSLATGAYIQFLDSDDVIMNSKIDQQIKLAENAGWADLVVGNYEKKFMDGARSEVSALEGDPWMALIRTELGTTSANLWKKSILEKIGGWDEGQKSSQDYQLMFRMLCENANVVFDPSSNTLVLKREKGSISRTGQMNNWVRYIELRVAMRAQLSKDPKKHSLHIDCLGQYIFMALRVLARFNIGLSIELFNKHLGKKFVPELSMAIDKRYLLLYRTFGFSTVERSIHMIKRSAA